MTLERVGLWATIVAAALAVWAFVWPSPIPVTIVPSVPAQFDSPSAVSAPAATDRTEPNQVVSVEADKPESPNVSGDAPPRADIRLQPAQRASPPSHSAATSSSPPSPAVRLPAETSNTTTEDTVPRPSRMAAPVIPALINEGARGSANRAVLFGDSTGRVDASVTSRVATALGATDSLFTPAFANQLFRVVQAGQLDSLRGLRLEHIGAIALGLISTRTESRNVNGAEFTEARAEIGVRVIYPVRDFAAQLIAVEDRGTGFTSTSATQAAVDRAVAKAIGELKSVF